MSRADLRVVGAEDDEDEQPAEVAVREPTEAERAELGDQATVDVPRAVDPPATHLGLPDLVGLDLPARKVIVPMWARSLRDARLVAWWLTRYVGHVVTYHVTRLPVYGVRAVVRLIVGLGRAVALYWAWLWDSEGRQMARTAHGGADQGAWAKARKEWKETVHRRWLGSVVAAVALVIGVVCAALWAPSGWLPAVGLLLAVLLVRLGAPADKPLLDTYYTSKPGDTFRLTSTIVLRALTSLAIAGMKPTKDVKASDHITFPKPIVVDGPGFRAEVDLPHGITAAQVMEKRAELASGLRRPLGTVWPEPMPDVHAGRLSLWVGNIEMSQINVPSPIEKDRFQADAFGDLPFGFDQRRRPIAFSLMYANLLIGSLPDGGKTAAVRNICLALALDATVELRVAEHKGSGDLGMLEPLAHFYVSGVADEHVEATVGQLRSLLKECEKRAEKITELGKTTDLAPEAKVTRRSASIRKLGLHPIAMVIDEAQEVFGHDDYGKEAGKLAERLIKRGRALGIILILATQRPDKHSLPTGITANTSHRYCLRVTDQVTNDMILGTSAYSQGIQATTLSPKDKGIGYLRGAFDDAVVVRSYYQDGPLAKRIAARALELRRAAGTVTGQAAGEEPEQAPSYSLLDDLQTIFVTCERTGMHSETVCERLREIRPDAYEDWTPATLAAALPEGLRTEQVSLQGWNRRGLKRDRVLAAIAERETLQIEDGR